MKKYHVQNYIRWKEDMANALKELPNAPYEELNRDQLIVKFLPLVESIARKFSTAQQASGVMSIMDFIQEGNYGLCAAVDRIDWDTILVSENKENEQEFSSFTKDKNEDEDEDELAIPAFLRRQKN